MNSKSSEASDPGPGIFCTSIAVGGSIVSRRICGTYTKVKGTYSRQPNLSRESPLCTSLNLTDLCLTKTCSCSDYIMVLELGFNSS